MSSRAFRRLGGDPFTIKLPAGTGGEEEDEDEEGDISLQPVSLQSQKKNKFNPFDMLNDSNESPQEEEEEEEEEKEEQTSKVAVTSQSSSRKKKKKKKRATNKQNQSTPTVSNEDEVEAALREVTDMLGGLETVSSSQSESSSSRTPCNQRPLLCVDRRNLNAENEMRRIFGSRVVRGEQTSQRRHHRRKHQRQTVLATPKDTWPQIERLGLSMSLEEVKDSYEIMMK
ncbi:PREDICTED: ribosome quality control complex subunit 1-like [Amphimedon queenslandica]|uniref:Uncharacterized protein n=1 Tax=Amphimedon queenslandica TaxID=400682 RepID=A0AAN0JRL4_AMPQE|nr:PREDICTED: ribosome quality control complex subunit 1-like [Amphimedon queenslandica]|eukprot:XP_019859489.1 PREDICTED: ribosome quality control complex subunit 1-like [Amphimedon queenslandica]